MIADGVHHLSSSVHQIHDPRRQPRLLQELHRPAHREGHLFRRLEHERVAGHDGERQKPHRHHRRKIERCDRRTHAERLPHDMAVDPLRDVLEARSLHQRRRSARDLDTLDAAPYAAARFVDGLAVFGGDDPRHFVEVLLQLRFQAVEHLRPRVHRRVPPGRKRMRRREHGRIDIRGCRERGAADDFADRRVVHVEELGGLSLHPAPADEVVEDRGLGRDCNVRHWELPLPGNVHYQLSSLKSQLSKGSLLRVDRVES